MVHVAEHTLREVDVILFLVEPSTFIGAGDKHIIEQLKKAGVPVILLINKIDMLAQKEELLPIIDAYRKEMDFDQIIPISAFNGDGTKEVLDAIFSFLPYGPMFYDEDTVTDQPQRQIVAELIREQALRILDDEIPHGIAVSVEQMKVNKKIVDIDATIICEKDSHKGIIIGKGGQMLKRIGTNARHGIEDMMQCRVNLKLWVKVKKDWRDSDYLLKNFGYNQKEIDL